MSSSTLELILTIPDLLLQTAKEEDFEDLLDAAFENFKSLAGDAARTARDQHFEELYGEDEEEDEEMPTVDSEDCPPFERYSGNNPIYLQINEAYDRWNSWEPQNPTEQMLKNAINSNEHMGA